MMLSENYPKITPAAARVNAGMNQDEACRKIGICKSSLQNYESGKTIPPWNVVQKMGEVYEFPADLIVFKSITV